MPVIRVGQAAVEYGDVGEGPVLLLLHTLLADRSVYDRVLPALSQGRRVLTPNFPGYGETRGTPGEAIEDYADLVAGFLDALGIERVDLLGNGFGGFVATAFALRHGLRVDRLMLVDTAPWFPDPAKVPLRGLQQKVRAEGMAGVLDAAMLRMFPKAYVEAAPATIAERKAALGAADPALFAVACGALLALDHRPRLKDIPHRTLVMVGLEDETTPPALSRELAANIPDATLVELEGIGHCPQVQGPEAFAAEVRRFLDA